MLAQRSVTSALQISLVFVHDENAHNRRGRKVVPAASPRIGTRRLTFCAPDFQTWHKTWLKEWMSTGITLFADLRNGACAPDVGTSCWRGGG
eukprot:1796606-Rhodomonas_salina.2